LRESITKGDVSFVVCERQSFIRVNAVTDAHHLILCVTAAPQPRSACEDGGAEGAGGVLWDKH